MAESFLTLSRSERLEALGVAATASSRPAYLLEKDIWVVWALQGLFESKMGEHLVFKGGTSLSKGYDIIERFSEDIDLTYDVRRIIPELATGDPPIPATNSQAKKWTDTTRERLTAWVKDEALPILQKHAEATGVDVTFRVDGHVVYVDYDPLTEGSEYVPPWVKLEFGARSTGEPAESRDITHAMRQSRCPNSNFQPHSPRSCCPSAHSGKRPLRFTCFALKTVSKAIEFPVTGTIWCGSTMRAMPKPRLTTTRWRRKSPIGKASSFACVITTGSGLIITPLFPVSFNWCRTRRCAKNWR